MVKKIIKIKKILNIANKEIDKTLLRVLKPVIRTIGVKEAMRRHGVSKAVAKREIESAIKRKLRS